MYVRARWRGALLLAGVLALVGPWSAVAGTGREAAAAPVSPLTSADFVQQWSTGPFTGDKGQPIAESSPVVADLDQPSVVVGDRTGYLYALHLSDGSEVSGWPAYDGGAPVDSTPSVAYLTGTAATIFVGSGNAQSPTSGGYQAFDAAAQLTWSAAVTNPASDKRPATGVQASMAVGELQGRRGVFAGSLGQESYALDASTGSVLGGWPFFSADSIFSTAAVGDLYGSGSDEWVVGGASTAGTAYGEHYSDGGHVRILDGEGRLLYDYDTDQEVDSSPAVGPFLGGGATGIVVGTGSYWPGASDTDRLLAFTTRLERVWSVTLDGYTSASPALADITGDGSLDVVEGTDMGTAGGSAWALDGADGSVLWHVPVSGRVIGSPVAADLNGSGYDDVLVPTIHGVDVLDGRTGNEVAVLRSDLGFQNSPLVTDDPDGAVGITLAGYNGDNEGVVVHYEVTGSDGAGAVGPGAWPMFHHDPSLSGLSSPLPDLGLSAPEDLSAVADGGDVQLSWSPPPGGPVPLGYNVYAGTWPGHEGPLPLNGSPLTGTSWTVPGLTGGQTYYFDMTAVAPAGEGPPSAEASAALAAASTTTTSTAGTAAPTAPVALGPAPFVPMPPAAPAPVATTTTAPGPTGVPAVTTTTSPARRPPRPPRPPHVPGPRPGRGTAFGYLLVGRDGRVAAAGGAGPGRARPWLPGAVAAAALPQGHGYWLLSPTGTVLAVGSARPYGSVPAGPYSRAVGIVATPDGRGYWVATSAGLVFAFGDARAYHLRPPALPRGQRARSLLADPRGPGYWEVTTAGTVAVPAGAQHLSSRLGPVPVLGSACPGVVGTASAGAGYWWVAPDGRVCAAGGARDYGSVPAKARGRSKAVGLVATSDRRGYWVALSDGQVLGFGDAARLPATTHPVHLRAVALIA